VCLRDVLHAAGVREGARHVEFVGLDQVERHGRQFGFGGSIDLAKADDVILAHELNGKALPAVHGFPLRAVVPGWIGARSVKWLGRITLLNEPSSNYFQARAYRFLREVNPQDPRDVSGGTALTEVPLNSVILHPEPSQVVPAGRVRVSGWAIGSGGRALTAVQLSSNGGTDWTPAHVVTASAGRTWSYWEVTLDLVPGRYSLVVRAADTTGIPQPSSIDATWNVKGYNNNAWHRVTAEVI
jgi:sulfite oxidase